MNTIRFVVASFVLACLAAPLAAQDAAPSAPPQKGPQAEKTAAKPVYDEKADAKEQIAAALARAKKENRRVLVQWGGNWCPWCVKLHALFESNPEVARKLLYEYDVVYVDAGRPAGKNIDLGTSYSADLKQHGFPFLTVLDADGKPLANQETSAFEKDGKSVEAGHDPQKMLEFLAKHEAPRRDARAVLDAGLAEAKKGAKHVFLHFGAPWCGWCHRLEDWMARADIRALLAKDFVDVKIDIDRTTGGKDLLAKFTGGKQPGIPWFVFLDADGKPLIDSNRETGDAGTNVGFPAEKPEIEHFEKMLRKTARNLADADIRALVQSLSKPGEPR